MFAGNFDWLSRGKVFAIGGQRIGSPRETNAELFLLSYDTGIDAGTESKVPAALPGNDSSISKTPKASVLVSTTRGRNARAGTARLGTHPENPWTYIAGALLSLNGQPFVEPQQSIEVD